MSTNRNEALFKKKLDISLHEMIMIKLKLFQVSLSQVKSSCKLQHFKSMNKLAFTNKSDKSMISK